MPLAGTLVAAAPGAASVAAPVTGGAGIDISRTNLFVGSMTMIVGPIAASGTPTTTIMSGLPVPRGAAAIAGAGSMIASDATATLGLTISATGVLTANAAPVAGKSYAIDVAYPV